MPQERSGTTGSEQWSAKNGQKNSCIYSSVTWFPPRLVCGTIEDLRGTVSSLLTWMERVNWSM